MIIAGLFIMLMAMPLVSVGREQAVGAHHGGVHVQVGLDMATRYQWRGMLLSPGAVAQPHIALSRGGLAFGIWASSTLHAFAWQETDLYVSYTWNNLSLSVLDYFYYQENNPDMHYFNYQRNTTGHVIEAVIEFAGTDQFPFRLLGGYNMYGADASRSVYVEAAWQKSAGEADIEVFAGYAPMAGYYHETKNGLANAGVSVQKMILSTAMLECRLRVSAIYNPFSKQAFLVAGIGIH